MDSIFDFMFNQKTYYTLIGLDIIEGLDGQFYVVDVNGLIGLRRITQHLELFNQKLKSIFNEDYYFEIEIQKFGFKTTDLFMKIKFIGEKNLVYQILKLTKK